MKKILMGEMTKKKADAIAKIIGGDGSFFLARAGDSKKGYGVYTTIHQMTLKQLMQASDSMEKLLAEHMMEAIENMAKDMIKSGKKDWKKNAFADKWSKELKNK